MPETNNSFLSRGKSKIQKWLQITWLAALLAWWWYMAGKLDGCKNPSLVNQTTEISQEPISINLEQIITQAMLDHPLSSQTVPYHTTGILDKKTNILWMGDIFGKYDNIPYELSSKITIDMGIGAWDIAGMRTTAIETPNYIVIPMSGILTWLHILKSSNDEIRITSQDGIIFEMEAEEYKQLSNSLLNEKTRDSIASEIIEGIHENPEKLSDLQKTAAWTLFALGGEWKSFFEQNNMMKTKKPMSMIFSLANGHFFQVVASGGTIYGREFSESIPKNSDALEIMTNTTISNGSELNTQSNKWIVKLKG